jgi:F0F1-type ATP synthase alpha subunit
LRRIEIPIPSDTEGLRRRELQHIDDLISMSDGQIWLDERFEQAGRQPPMDPQRSITRVGIGADTKSRADAPAIRRVVEGLRLDWAQAASMDGADLGTKASVKQIRKSGALLLAMHQRPGSKGRTLSESCVALLAATKGHLDLSVDQGVRPGTEQGDFLLSGLFDHVRKVAPEATKAVDDTQDMSESSYAEIEDAIKSYFVTLRAS